MAGNRLYSSIKGKVIIAFLASGMAISAAWFINKIAFREMLETVDKISSPDDKLKTVNHIFHQMINLEQLQKINANQNIGRSYNTIKRESNALQLSLDTLKMLCEDNPVQVKLIDSVKQLLVERNKTLIRYLNVRENLVNNTSIIQQIDTLGNLVIEPGKDSIVVSSQYKTRTTTFEVPGSAAKDEEEKKGLLARVFSKKKKNDTALDAPEPKLVQEEVSTRVDTLVYAAPDSTRQKADQLIRSINTKQASSRKKFEAQEAQLALIEKNSVAQIMHVLNEVEKDVISQTAADSRDAQKLVRKSTQQTGIILMVFFGLTAILVILVFSDIAKSNTYRTQLVEAKEEAELHSHARQRFLANMSHEIRTPLQSIIGYSEQLRKNGKPDGEKLDAIHSSSQHLLQIVNEVLDYSRITSGKFTFEISPFNLQTLLQEMMLVLQPQAETKGIKLVLEDDTTDLPVLKGDAFRLKQVLFNLVGNAIKFTDAGQVKLAVSAVVRKKDTLCTFVVEDTGIGISEENVAAIFNQFEQADATISNRYGGTGLGLSIVKSLVEAQQGTIDVNSRFGEGSRFIVTLKFSNDAPVGKSKTRSSKKPLGFSGKVWIVDDDKLILQLCDTIFNYNHIPHSAFASAEELLNADWDNEVAIVFTDIRLSGISGVQLCETLRKRHGHQIKIIALTAQALPEERSVLLQSGFDHILLKPFNEQQLIERVGHVTPAPPSVEVGNFSLEELEKMTYGDKEQMTIVLQQFIEDNDSDAASLDEAIAAKDIDTCILLIHRMAGRTAQVCNKELGASFRKYEIETERTRDIDFLKSIQPVMHEQLNQLALQVKAAIEEILV